MTTFTPTRPRPPRERDPRRVAETRAGFMRSLSTALFPLRVAAASRQSTASGSGFEMGLRAGGSPFTPFTNELGNEFRDLRFPPNEAYGLGSGRLNATTFGVSFSLPPNTRGTGNDV